MTTTQIAERDNAPTTPLKGMKNLKIIATVVAIWLVVHSIFTLITTGLASPSEYLFNWIVLFPGIVWYHLEASQLLEMVYFYTVGYGLILALMVLPVAAIQIIRGKLSTEAKVSLFVGYSTLALALSLA